MKTAGLCLAAAVGLAAICGIVFSGEAAKAPPNDGIKKIGEVEVDFAKKEARIKGKIKINQGLVEYFACIKNSGKDHETALSLDCTPLNLQTALILLGLNYKQDVRVRGDPRIPQGDPVYIYIEWEADTGKKKVRAEDLVYDVVAKAPMERTYWAFTGSRFIKAEDQKKEIFGADIEGVIIATFRDPNAVLNNPLKTGEDDVYYVMNQYITPKSETPVVVTIMPAPDAKKVEPEEPKDKK